MTFKELIDKTTVSWANKLINEKDSSLADELNSLNTEQLIPGIKFNAQDAVNEFSKIKSQLPVLKTYADVFGYAKLNETDIQKVLSSGLGSPAAQELLPNGVPDVAKLIAKVQIGGVFATITYTKPLVTSLLDKIGRDTPIKDVNLDDINYLITKNIDTEVDQIFTADESTHLLDEVSEELKQLKDPSASWDKKDNDRQIIEIYLTKLRDKFLNSPMQTAILTNGAPMNSMKVQAGTKIMGAMNSLSAKVEYGNILESAFLQAKNN